MGNSVESFNRIRLRGMVVVSSRDLVTQAAADFVGKGHMEKVITSLKLNVQNPNRVQVVLDGKSTLKLIKSIAADLRVGQQLTEEDIRQLRQRNGEEKVFQQALGLISRRPRSVYELRARFAKRNIEPIIQEAVITRLDQSGLLNDMAFAKAWIENRQDFRPRSAWALKVELRRKGVSAEVIESALTDFDEHKAVLHAAAIGARKYRSLPREEFRKRLGAYLSRRGFHYDLISPTVECLWHEISDGEEESEVMR